MIAKNFILQIICTFFMVIYAISPSRSLLGRIFAIAMIIVAWYTPYGWIAALAWGALCWSHARAGGG